MDDSHRSSDHSQQKEIWERFVGGDQAGFKLLFRKYYRQMFGYGTKLCDDPELVKDCIQDLFKTVWERRNDLDHVCSPNVYLFVSLRRKILKRIEKRSNIESGLDGLEEDFFADFNKEELIITDEKKHQQKAALHEALNQLSSRQKEVIYLHYYNGMSYREIEKILSINRQSVYNHMSRAMETLRTILDNEIMKLVISLLVFFLYHLPYYL